MNDTLFNNRAGSYSRGRPKYSEAALDCLFEQVGFWRGCSVADVGAGTGIFSRVLAERGCRVVCCEPNAEMRTEAYKTLAGVDGVHIVDGSAEDTTLESSCVDFITAAQAFHWFEPERFAAESRRILRDGGKAALIWNYREPDSEYAVAQSKLFERFCPEFRGFSDGFVLHDKRISLYFEGLYDFAAFPYPLVFTRERFVNRCLSASYSLREGDESFAEYLDTLNDLFERFCKDDMITIPNQTIVYWGRP